MFRRKKLLAEALAALTESIKMTGVATEALRETSATVEATLALVDAAIADAAKWRRLYESAQEKAREVGELECDKYPVLGRWVN